MNQNSLSFRNVFRTLGLSILVIFVVFVLVFVVTVFRPFAGYVSIALAAVLGFILLKLPFSFLKGRHILRPFVFMVFATVVFALIPYIVGGLSENPDFSRFFPGSPKDAGIEALASSLIVMVLIQQIVTWIFSIRYAKEHKISWKYYLAWIPFSWFLLSLFPLLFFGYIFVSVRLF